MDIPARIEPKGLSDYLEIMSKSVFQTGISWRVVESKWPGISEAFRGFDPWVVAEFGEPEIEQLSQDTRVIRNRRKIEAIVGNAARIVDLDKRYGGFQKYLRSHPSFDDLLKDLKKQFKFLGDMGAYHFLWVVGEEVPPYETWCAGRATQPRRSTR
jgi:3-methyladenine DNA glycosylase Tag